MERVFKKFNTMPVDQKSDEYMDLVWGENFLISKAWEFFMPEKIIKKLVPTKYVIPTSALPQFEKIQIFQDCRYTDWYNPDFEPYALFPVYFYTNDCGPYLQDGPYSFWKEEWNETEKTSEQPNEFWPFTIQSSYNDLLTVYQNPEMIYDVSYARIVSQMGSGFTDFTSPNDGSRAFDTRVLELKNGDYLLCACWEWYNK